MICYNFVGCTTIVHVFDIPIKNIIFLVVICPIKVVDMSPQNHQMTPFINDLYSSLSFDTAFDVYDKQVQALGFGGALYAFIPKVLFEGDLCVAPIFKISDTRDPNYLKHYIEASFEKDDFTLQSVINGRAMMLDWWKEEKKGLLMPAERNVILTAKEDYKMNNGITIPTMNNQRGIAGASVISEDKSSSYELLVAENSQALELCTQVFHQHVMAHPQIFNYFLLPILEKLTATEKRLLPYIANGLPMKAINLTPTISEKYADKLLRSIREKFGNISKGRLIYYIGLLQVLDCI